MDYAKRNYIKIDEDAFFNIGNLYKQTNLVSRSMGGSSYPPRGSDNEIDKFKLIKKLNLAIDKHNQWKNTIKTLIQKNI